MKKLIAVLGLVVGACGPQETSDGRFVTYGQQDEWSDRLAISEFFLISRVHEESWQIAWLVDETCYGYQRPTQQDLRHQASNRLERLTEELIGQWLEALAEVASGDLVDNFEFSYLDADDLMPTLIKALTFEKLTTSEQQLIEDLQEYELAIHYDCQPGEHGELGIAYAQGITLYSVEATADDLQFQPGVLLHEIGHIFGLVDTYVQGNVHELESTGGSPNNVGQQPDSVMSSSYNTLSEDDKRGIRWLYLYYHDNSISPDDCIFSDYKEDVIPSPTGNFRGCRTVDGMPPEPLPPVNPPQPEDPPPTDDDQQIESPERTEPRNLSRGQRIDLAKQLLAKMKQQAPERELVQFLSNNPELIVNRYDLSNGYTALHYALVNRYREVVELLLAHPQIDVNRRTWHGDTPLHLAVLAEYEDGIRALLAQPNIRVNAYKYVDGGQRVYIRDYALVAGLGWLVREIDSRN